MALSHVCAFALAAAIAGSPAIAPGADRKLVVGIPPLDVAAVDGVDASAGQSLAKLIRIEMIKNVRLQPVLLTEVPAKPDAPKPDATADDAKPAAPAVATDILLVGTVVAADSEQSSRDVSSPSLLGGNLNIGGKVGRATATVSLHIELVDPKSGDTVDSFDVESKISETGIGTDLQTAAGNFDSGDPSFDKAPMGKALRDAAQKVAAELAKRADKLTPRS